MLKAILCQTLGDRATKALGHDLAAAWAAAAEGLPLATEMPDWATRLDDLHDKPHKVSGWPSHLEKRG